MMNLKINPKARERNIKRCRERGIVIPTFEQMKHPEKIRQDIVGKLREVGLWDVNPLNLFRITWKNEPKEKGGGFKNVNYMVFPSELTGVEARIVALVGKWFPTGAHKVGATFGCLVPALVTGNFDSTRQMAVWPSTGNYCRGGAYDSALLGCKSIAILPEGMSKERFEWLNKISGEVIKTPGSESNVKEIFDKCKELRQQRGDQIVIFNQFEEFGNYLWHYDISGNAILEVIKEVSTGSDRVAGYVSSTGSAGTIAAGDLLKRRYPELKICAGEALQCPTLLCNGFGEHRIEGIGDKHVPWIHNVKNTDIVAAVDDQDCINVMRLFNEEEGRKYLTEKGVPRPTANSLDLLGISGIANLLASIKFAKYYELDSTDIVITILTDSMDLYQSRIVEEREKHGSLSREDAVGIFSASLPSQRTHMLELDYYEGKRIHNLKYYTWIEQQGKDVNELNAQWYDKDYWTSIQDLVPSIDRHIMEFNKEVGL